MRDWQFWGLISMLFILNSNVVDNNVSSLLSYFMAIATAIYAINLRAKDRADKS